MKFKKWIKEHKKELVIMATGAVVGGVLGVRIANKTSQYPRSVVKTLLPVLKDSDGAAMAYRSNSTATKLVMSQSPELLGDLLDHDCVNDLLKKEITGIAVFYKD